MCSGLSYLEGMHAVAPMALLQKADNRIGCGSEEHGKENEHGAFVVLPCSLPHALQRLGFGGRALGMRLASAVLARHWDGRTNFTLGLIYCVEFCKPK